MLYFAYGSNLNAKDLARSTGRADFLTPVGPALLPDRALAFTYFSPSRGGGALDVVPRPGAVVVGMLFHVAPGGWAVLDRKEGHPHWLRRIRVVVLDEEGVEVEAETYEVVTSRREAFVAPRPDYLAVVRAGLRAHGLAAGLEPLAAAARGEVASAVEALFVYGTLMQGECRHGALAPAGVRNIRPAIAPGRLLDCGAWPGMVRAVEEAEQVRGEVVRVADLEMAVRCLDRVEGFRGFGRGGSLFVRRVVQVAEGRKAGALAWTYRLAAPAGELVIASGSWREHRGPEGRSTATAEVCL